MASRIQGIELSRNGMLALVTVIGIVAAAILVFFLIRGGDEDDKGGKNTSASPPVRIRPSTPPPTPGQVVNPEVMPPPPSPNASIAATVTANARGFATAWSRNGIPREQWYADVEKYCTEDFARQMALIDPKTRPTVYSGEPKVDVNYGYAIAKVPVNEETMTLTFRYIDNKWLIEKYAFEKRQPS